MKMDLKDLAHLHGVPAVARTLDVSERNFLDLRRGRTALTADDLHKLLQAWPEFDVRATVQRVGGIRDRGGTARKYRSADTRRGGTSLNIDDLYELLRADPDFDVEAVVAQVGGLHSKLRGIYDKAA